MYRVTNHISGFVNCYMGIAARPDAFLARHADAPLGQRSFAIRLLNPVKADTEILIAYGAEHTVRVAKSLGSKTVRKLKLKKSATP